MSKKAKFSNLFKFDFSRGVEKNCDGFVTGGKNKLSRVPNYIDSVKKYKIPGLSCDMKKSNIKVIFFVSL